MSELHASIHAVFDSVSRGDVRQLLRLIDEESIEVMHRSHIDFLSSAEQAVIQHPEGVVEYQSLLKSYGIAAATELSQMTPRSFVERLLAIDMSRTPRPIIHLIAATAQEREAVHDTYSITWRIDSQEAAVYSAQFRHNGFAWRLVVEPWGMWLAPGVFNALFYSRMEGQ